MKELSVSGLAFASHRERDSKGMYVYRAQLLL